MIRTRLPSIERQVAAAVMVAALLAVATALGVMTWLQRAHARADADANRAVDAIAQAIANDTEPQPLDPQALLDTFVAAGSIRAATVYAAGGAVVARSGTPSPDVEQDFRSLPGGGSLSVERSVPSGTRARDRAVEAALAVGSAAVLATVAAFLGVRTVRRRIDRLRLRVEESLNDPTYATRLDEEAGALRPLAGTLNRLLDQTQKRDVVLRRRTMDLESANKELESFAATVSHDLRAPVGSIAGFAQALEEDYAPQLDDTGRECIHWIRHSAQQMSELIEGMLQMARLARTEVHRTEVDLSRIARDIADGLQRANPERDVDFVIAEGIVANGDERLLHVVLDNLLGNAFKFTSKRPAARIEVGARNDAGTSAFYVRDNGAGFAPEHAAKMFRPFQRLHSEKEFSGTGIGLATVHRIVERHGGRIWAEGEPGKGATVYFTTGIPEEWAA
ncbi:MAG TPA: ATP-binding protein [Thermoanaerobaculia bacterium]|nr:ATP-binding protein [Thermoanaerobaculia bacterium]